MKMLNWLYIMIIPIHLRYGLKYIYDGCKYMIWNSRFFTGLIVGMILYKNIIVE